MQLRAKGAAAVRRLSDRRKWPRRWWWPLQTVLELELDEWTRQHDEVSKTINRLLVVLVGYSFFCLLSLGHPDRSLIANHATIRLPFANAEISFVAFVFVGPFILVGLLVYLQLFVGYWLILSRSIPKPSPVSTRSVYGLPFVFNLPSRFAAWASTFLLYWLVPVVLAVFAWKALPIRQGPFLLALCCAVTGSLAMLQIRRRPEKTFAGASIFLGITVVAMVFIFLQVSRFVYSPTLLPPHQVRQNTWIRQARRPWFLSRSLDLSNADLAGQSLTAVDLNGANLTDANLQNVFFQGAVLEHSSLFGANLTAANLTGAYMSYAMLVNSNLSHADLSYADLNHALLWGANLRNALLDGTDFSGAELDHANLSGARLGQTKGLVLAQLKKACGDDETILPADMPKISACN